MQSAQAILLNIPEQPVEPPKHVRYEMAKKCTDAAPANFSDAYRSFVLDYAATHETFSNEEIRREYDKAGLPQPFNKEGKLEWRAAGGIIQALVAKGQLNFLGTTISPTRKSDIKVFCKGI